ncbi:hypothetical protein [Baaleninema sp.]|uniref:hypothetical protein n=1 Tax=Baaleninema sp. TaxID=3101197 RepID=UPI003D033D90
MATEFEKLQKFKDIFGLSNAFTDEPSFFVSNLSVSQNGLFVGESTTLTFQVKAANPSSSPGIQLFEVDETGEANLVEILVDDGNVAIGDDIAGDGVFSGQITLSPDSPGQKTYFATIPNSDEETDNLQIDIVQPLTDEQWQTILDFNQQVESNFVELLDSGQSSEQAIANIVADLQANPERAKSESIVATASEVLWETPEGILTFLDSQSYLGGEERGVNIGTEQVSKNAPDDTTTSAASFQTQALSTLNSSCNNALVLGPYANEFEPNDETNEIAQTLENAGFNVIEKRNESDDDRNVNVEDFKNLHLYDVVAISSHGGNWGGKGIIVTTSQQDNPENRDLYEVDLQTQRLALSSSNTYAVTSSFFETYTGEMSDTIVYIGSCSSTANDALAQTFLDKGAAAFIGYSDTVGSGFANERGQRVFEELVAGTTVGQITGINQDRETDDTPALFQLFGDENATISLAEFKNGDFESGDLSCWSIQGDTRVITALGSLQPPEGNQMAIISTGLGSVNDSQSEIARSFLVPENAENLRLTYNVVSEEPLEFVGTAFDDQFDILLDGGTLASERVNTSAWQSIDGIDFFGGDSTVYETGWEEVSIDLTPYRGQIVDLQIRTFDRGDSLFDTAALIDDIRIEMV